MKLKDLLIMVGFVMLSSWAIQYFVIDKFFRKSDEVGRFTVAPVQQEQRPLETEVDFVDTKRTAKTQVTPVKTSWGQLEFTTDGGTLSRLVFERRVDNALLEITTLFPPTDHEKEKRAFLVAFEQKTPYFYALNSKEVLTDATRLSYTAKNADIEIEKIFTVFHEKHQIDLDITIKNNTLGRPRIFFPSPYMPQLGDKDAINGIVINKTNNFERIARGKIDTAHQGWYTPKLFGADDRYYIHAMVRDQDSFTQRAYFAYLGEYALMSILEGPQQENITASLSFYMGPKESSAIAPIDSRLEQTFEYSGLLSPISKLLLMILNWLESFLGNYGYAIIALTVLIRLLLFPFTMRSEQTLKESAERQKKLAYIEKKYKDDPQALARERMEFMKKHGMPGLGMGCLPLLVQIPVFFALSRVLSNSIELYHAPLWWISDLSARDPYYVIPVLMVSAMIGQALFADPKQRVFMLVAALVFGAFSSSLPAGLAIYLLVSTVLAALQTYVMKWFK